jgi:hypothetical protein
VGGLKLPEVAKTSLNKKKLNLRAQSADRYKNGRIFHEYSLFGLAWKHHRVGLPKNLATARLPPLELAILSSKIRQGNP